MNWCLLILIISSIGYIENANILGVFPLPGKSHFMMFEAIVKGLVDKGHTVDVLSHFPQKEPILGYNDLSLVGSTDALVVNNISVTSILNRNRLLSLGMMFSLGGTDTCTATFNSRVAQRLRNTTKKYDLVLVELFTTDCMLGWGYHFKAPVVALSSCVSLSWANDRFGNPDNPAYIPTFELPYMAKMTLYERVVNTFYLLSAKLCFYFLSDRPSNQLAKKFFGPDLPDLKELAYNTSLLLVNSHFSTNQARPVVPNYVEVGGLHIKAPKPLDKHFQELILTDTRGIILFTMGSMIQIESFPVEKIQALFDAFAKLPYKVLCKADKEKFPKKLKYPSNLHFETWIPQFDILCHPNVKLFISHGGLMGSQEATYCGVPRLGIPLFGDQEMNVKQLENMGLAIRVSFDNITKNSILEAARELLGNPKYKKNAVLFSQLFKDRPQSALDTALYWIEYVMRHKGAHHLRSEGSRLAWYQYHLLDVGLIFVLVLLGLGYVLFFIFKCLFRGSAKRKVD